MTKPLKLLILEYNHQGQNLAKEVLEQYRNIDASFVMNYERAASMLGQFDATVINAPVCIGNRVGDDRSYDATLDLARPLQGRPHVFLACNPGTAFYDAFAANLAKISQLPRELLLESKNSAHNNHTFDPKYRREEWIGAIDYSILLASTVPEGVQEPWELSEKAQKIIPVNHRMKAADLGATIRRVMTGDLDHALLAPKSSYTTPLWFYDTLADALEKGIAKQVMHLIDFQREADRITPLVFSSIKYEVKPCHFEEFSELEERHKALYKQALAFIRDTLKEYRK
jgi:hypothetical protein